MTEQEDRAARITAAREARDAARREFRRVWNAGLAASAAARAETEAQQRYEDARRS